MIKAIIFDCFGVLTTDTWRAFIDSLPPEADIEAARDAHRAYDAGVLSKEEAADRILDATGRHFTEVEDIFAGEMAKNAALMEYIKVLKKTYKIGLLSNVATPWITDTFLTAEEQKLFDALVFSYEVGMTKPDPRIFQITCERLDVKPEEAVLVDDIDRYCQAAKEAGMEALVYTDLHQLKHYLSRLLNHS